MLANRTDRAKALANTYVKIRNRTGWQRVQEYQRVLEYRGEHPNAGSQAVATALELPRSRIRPWFDGARPDPVYAIDTTETNGWLDTQPGDRTFEALSVLTAWVFAGGSIARESWVPLFVVGSSDPCGLAVEALETVGLSAHTERAHDPERATEIRPAESGGPHLGRYLHAVGGAPIGNKANRTDISLPTWLSTVSDSTRLRFARTYVSLRGTAMNERHGYVQQLREERTQTFINSLSDLFQSLTPPGTVTTGQKIIRLRPAAARELDVVPSLPPTSDGG